MTIAKTELQKTIFVCVDSFENGVPKGRIYGARQTHGRSFSNLLQLLLLTEQNLDDANTPQAFSEMRRFTPQKKCSSEMVEEVEKNGKVSTFVVRILFRQNASWQGSVTWLEGETEEVFRSALELIFLMNSALDSETL